MVLANSEILNIALFDASPVGSVFSTVNDIFGYLLSLFLLHLAIFHQRLRNNVDGQWGRDHSIVDNLHVNVTCKCRILIDRCDCDVIITVFY